MNNPLKTYKQLNKWQAEKIEELIAENSDLKQQIQFWCEWYDEIEADPDRIGEIIKQAAVCPNTAIEKDTQNLGEGTQNGNTDTLNDRGSNQYANPEQCRHLGETRMDGGMTFCEECGVELL